MARERAPSLVTTARGPVTAPIGTSTLSRVSLAERTATSALSEVPALPRKITSDAPARLLPLSRSVLPA